MTVWHAVQAGDREAQRLAAEYRAIVQLAGGDLIASLGFGSVPPVLVLTLLISSSHERRPIGSHMMVDPPSGSRLITTIYAPGITNLAASVFNDGKTFTRLKACLATVLIRVDAEYP